MVHYPMYVPVYQIYKINNKRTQPLAIYRSDIKIFDGVYHMQAWVISALCLVPLLPDFLQSHQSISHNTSSLVVFLMLRTSFQKGSVCNQECIIEKRVSYFHTGYQK